MQVLSSARSRISAATIFGVVMGFTCLANAENKKPPAPVPKPAAPAARPAGNPGAGTSYRPNAAGPSTNRPGPSGPSANRPGVSGPSANHPVGPSANHPVGPSAEHPVSPGGNHPTGPIDHAGPGPDRGRAAMPVGVHEHVGPGGSTIRTRADGRPSDIHDHARGIDVHHNLAGGRRVSMERPDHSRVFADHGRRGFVERPYSFHGHDFARRSYFYHGHAYDRFYRGYGYRGLYLNVYAPGFYYRPAFYGWAYNPWATPIAFGWGWGGSPWFGYYGGFFQPYAVYPSAAFWLTDYLISQDLQAEYAANLAAGEAAGAPPSAGGPELTPEVKQEIADEVRNQLALENAEAAQNTQGQDVDPGSSGIARLLSDGRPHVFVAGGVLDVVDVSSGQECALSDGDPLQLQAPPPADATTANLVVLASKGGNECAQSSTVTAQLTDLQEMQNHMRETIDQGLQELQAKQGTGGMPAAPPSAQGAPAPAPYEAVAPPPDPNVGSEIAQVDQQGDQSEKELTTGAPSIGAAPAASAAPASVELGQTTDQVQAALGAPARVANLGPKVIYYYSGMKVAFVNGKVSDVQ
jgi:hypothetical protein